MIAEEKAQLAIYSIEWIRCQLNGTNLLNWNGSVWQTVKGCLNQEWNTLHLLEQKRRSLFEAMKISFYSSENASSSLENKFLVSRRWIYV